MSRALGLDPKLYDYMLSVSPPEHPLLTRLRKETAALPMAGMQISLDQGRFFQLLVRLMNAKRCLEIGVFTGYSSLSVAMALPADGHITALDINDDWTSIARRYWQEAGVADRITLKLGPARQTLDAMIADGASGSYDFAFIDADKTGYAAYHERVLQLLRPGGLVAYDNVLWSGRVADARDTSEDTMALRALNVALAQDKRIIMAMLPIGDGVTLAVKL
jgi:predicted O-methyltransferase YrrM